MIRNPSRPTILLLLGGVVLALAYGGWQLSRSRSYQLFGELHARVETTERVVALTFDDGPTPEALRVLLPMLKDRGVRATFFLVGAELERHPELGRALVRDGHEIGNHSYSHRRMVFKSPGFITREIESTDALIRQAGHAGPIHFRPPYGKKLAVLPYLLGREGRTTVTWDVEPESDPAIAGDTGKLVAATRSAVRPGSIILLHVMYPSGAASLAAVPRIVDELRDAGYAFVTVSELLARRTAAGAGLHPRQRAGAWPQEQVDA